MHYPKGILRSQSEIERPHLLENKPHIFPNMRPTASWGRPPRPFSSLLFSAILSP